MTDKKIAEYFGITDRTLRNWRKGDKYKRRMVVALEQMAGKADDDRKLSEYDIDELVSYQDELMNDLECTLGELQAVQDFIATKAGAACCKDAKQKKNKGAQNASK